MSFQDSFLVGLWNATYMGPSAKLLYFATQIATFVGISKKIAIFITESAAFSGKSTNLLLLV